jgi:hypothetical protein
MEKHIVRWWLIGDDDIAENNDRQRLTPIVPIDDWLSPFSVNSLGMKVVDTNIQKMNGLQAAMVASALVIRDRFLEVKAMIVGRSANLLPVVPHHSSSAPTMCS